MALSGWERIAGNGDGSSWLDQMRDGRLPDDWPAGHAGAVAELLSALGERARHTRALAGFVDGNTPQPYAGSGFVQATHQRLPMNRKERYFTGTVLPGLIGDNGFAHIHRFLALCGLDVELQDPDSNPLDASQDIEFFTEYGFAESVHTSLDKARFTDRPYERDTPDVVIVGRDWLLAVEAKVYHRPTRQALEAQLAKQRVIVEYWTGKLALDPRRVAHVLLLPESLAEARQPLSVRVVTWEQVREAYGTVGAGYWLGVLRTALDRYEELASPEPTFRGNADAVIVWLSKSSRPMQPEPSSTRGWAAQADGTGRLLLRTSRAATGASGHTRFGCSR